MGAEASHSRTATALVQSPVREEAGSAYFGEFVQFPVTFAGSAYFGEFVQFPVTFAGLSDKTLAKVRAELSGESHVPLKRTKSLEVPQHAKRNGRSQRAKSIGEINYKVTSSPKPTKKEESPKPTKIEESPKPTKKEESPKQTKKEETEVSVETSPKTPREEKTAEVSAEPTPKKTSEEKTSEVSVEEPKKTAEPTPKKTSEEKAAEVSEYKEKQSEIGRDNKEFLGKPARGTWVTTVTSIKEITTEEGKSMCTIHAYGYRYGKYPAKLTIEYPNCTEDPCYLAFEKGQWVCGKKAYSLKGMRFDMFPDENKKDNKKVRYLHNTFSGGHGPYKLITHFSLQRWGFGSETATTQDYIFVDNAASNFPTRQHYLTLTARKGKEEPFVNEAPKLLGSTVGMYAYEPAVGMYEYESAV